MQSALREALAAPAWRPRETSVDSDWRLSGVTTDSREVGPGVAFAALAGETYDGRNFIADAIARGAAAVLWQADGFRWRPEWRVPNVAVPDLQSAIGPIASEIYGRPSEALWMVGVTGTNGKTSCSTWIAQALTRLGRRCALIGTLGNGFIGNMATGTHTTPDAARLQRLISGFVAQGASHCAMEVSSHGLAQGRVNGVAFDVALFTNLTRDHLDYHGDMAHYGAAKARLFATPGLKAAVVNIDDDFGLRLVEALAGEMLPVLTYGIGQGDVAGEDVEFSADGIRMMVVHGGEQVPLTSRLIGNFNAHNLLGVIGVLLASQVSLAAAVEAVATLLPVDGRLQRIGGNGLPVVVIDYAHTPDALDKVLKTLRPLVPSGGRLFCVFGCGGDRDRGKRPLMGAIAAEVADVLTVTSDNPRGEAPMAIIADIVAGIAGQDFAVEEDRRAAILHAVAAAGSQDVVLIAGKGHETYQEIRGVRQPFSDLEEATRALAPRAEDETRKAEDAKRKTDGGTRKADGA